MTISTIKSDGMQAIQDVQYIIEKMPEAVKKYNDGVLDNLYKFEYKIRKQGDRFQILAR